MSKKTRLIQLTGNHDARAYKILIAKAPELEHMMDFKGPYQFKGVQTLHDSKDEFCFDGVLYTHGWMSGGAQGRMPHAKYFNMPVIHGHDHHAYLSTKNMKEGHLFEMSVGCLADFDALPMRYRPTKTTHWVHAIGTCERIGKYLHPHYFVL